MEPPAETPLRAAFVGAPEPIRRAAFRLPLKKYTQPKDLILAAKSDVVADTGVSDDEYLLMLEYGSLPLVPPLYAASSLAEQQRLLPTGLTELAGEAGSGKTQICMQLMMQVQLPASQGGREAGAVYLKAEGELPQRRLQQLARVVAQRSRLPESQDLLQQIFVEDVDSVSTLQNILDNRLPALLRAKHIGLVVLDSIAALARVEFGLADAPAKARLLATVAARLKQLSDESRVTVLVVNQMTDVIGDDHGVASGPTRVPALGLAWANCVNVRLVAWRSASSKRRLDDDTTVPERELELVFAPHLRPGKQRFVIESEGIRGLAAAAGP